ncbi:MAG: Rrf2 family transcriptional regulator [Roseivirga sp.]|nr:Rrf2 family transcriptional regulator [Roseivirga sp.]
MLSNACQYAIRAIVFLALQSDESQKIGVKVIAEKLESPQPFLSKLLQQLTRSELVSSTKGPNGGFYLTEKNKKNTLWDVILCIDGAVKFDQCFLGLSYCSDKNPCPVHFLASAFKKKVLAEFKDKSISQFADEIKSSGSVISLKDFDAFNK